MTKEWLMHQIKLIAATSRFGLTRRMYYAFMGHKWWKLYKKIEPPSNLTTYICPYVGTGDVYLGASLLSSRITDKEKEEVPFCVIGNSSAKVAKLFGYKNVIKLTQKEMDSISNMCIHVGFDNLKIKVLHHDLPGTKVGVSDNMRNYNGANFMDLYSAGIFGELNSSFDKPVFEDCIEEMKDLFNEYKLKEGKTVLLAPWSNTLFNLPEWFWVDLSEKLKEKGYTVCTNCFGDEEPIEGTEKIEIPYKKLKSFSEMAGYLVMIRSGFCEVVSSLDVHKIVLYQPNMFWGEGTNMDYFSMNSMGICDDAIEFECEGIEFLRLRDQVLEAIDR